MDGVTTTVKVAHVRLCHSRMPFVRAYPRETQEMVFDAHDKAFAFFGGACARGIYDSVHCCAIGPSDNGREDGRGHDLRGPRPRVQPPLPADVRALPRRTAKAIRSDGSRFSLWPCTPASGWEKGQVENQVGVIRRRLFVPRPRFKSYAEFNAWLEDRCVAWAKTHPHPELPGQTVWEVFEAERPSLVPYVGPFDGFHAVPASVSKTCLVRFDSEEE